MTINRILYFMLTLFSLTNSALANQRQEHDSLQSEREKVISQYIMDLKNADYHDIAQLFEKDGKVISTSKGNVNAKDFFSAFLPEIVSANTELHQTFTSNADLNHYAARFHFTFQLKDGEKGDGEYVDEFIFTDHSKKLSTVYMFENLKFTNDKSLIPRCIITAYFNGEIHSPAYIKLFDHEKVISNMSIYGSTQSEIAFDISWYLNDKEKFEEIKPFLKVTKNDDAVSVKNYTFGCD